MKIGVVGGPVSRGSMERNGEYKTGHEIGRTDTGLPNMEGGEKLDMLGTFKG